MLESAAPKGSQGVVGLLTPAREGGAQDVELRLERPDPDSEHQPSARDLVERAVALRDLERVVVAEDEHAGGESHRVGHRGKEPERRERVPVAAAPGLGDLGRDRHMFGAGEMVEAETVGGLGDPDHVLPARIPLPRCMGVGHQGDDRRDETEAHQRGIALDTMPRWAARRPGPGPA